MGISQEQAVKILQGLVDEVESLKNDVAFSEAHTRWLTNALSATEEIFGRGLRIYLSLAALPWRRTGSFIIDPCIQGGVNIINHALELGIVTRNRAHSIGEGFP